MLIRHPAGLFIRHPSGLFVRRGEGWPFAVLAAGRNLSRTVGFPGISHGLWQNTDWVDIWPNNNSGQVVLHSIDEPHGNRFVTYSSPNVLPSERFAPGVDGTGFAGGLCKLDPLNRIVWWKTNPSGVVDRGSNQYGDRVVQASRGAYLPTSDVLVTGYRVQNFSQGALVEDPGLPEFGIPPSTYYETDVEYRSILVAISGADGSVVSTQVVETGPEIYDARLIEVLAPIKNADRFIVRRLEYVSGGVSAPVYDTVIECRALGGAAAYSLSEHATSFSHSLRDGVLYVADDEFLASSNGYRLHNPETGALIASRSVARSVTFDDIEGNEVTKNFSSMRCVVAADEILGGCVIAAHGTQPSGFFGNTSHRNKWGVHSLGVAQSVAADGSVRWEYELAEQRPSFTYSQDGGTFTQTGENVPNALQGVSLVAPTWISATTEAPRILTVQHGESSLSRVGGITRGVSNNWAIHAVPALGQGNAVTRADPDFWDRGTGGDDPTVTSFQSMLPAWSSSTAIQIYAGVTLPVGVPPAGSLYGVVE